MFVFRELGFRVLSFLIDVDTHDWNGRAVACLCGTLGVDVCKERQLDLNGARMEHAEPAWPGLI